MNLHRIEKKALMETTVWVLTKCGMASYKEADGRDRVKCFIWIVDLIYRTHINET